MTTNKIHSLSATCYEVFIKTKRGLSMGWLTSRHTNAFKKMHSQKNYSVPTFLNSCLMKYLRKSRGYIMEKNTELALLHQLQSAGRKQYFYIQK